MVTKILSRPCGLIFSNQQYFVGEMRQHQMNLLYIANVTIIISVFSNIYNLVLQYKHINSIVDFPPE